MLKNIIVLPDGTEITNGVGAEHTIQSFNYTGSVNNGTELTIGSVFSNWIEVKFFTPSGNLTVPVGQEVTVYKLDDGGNRKQLGLFTLSKPERPSRNTYKFTAYDRVSWLDRDITDFLKSLDGWPYSLLTLAQMVCEECLLTLANLDIPNGDYPVNKFPTNKMTARELMGYIGQLAGRFCRATTDGYIEFAWYEDSGITLAPTGDRYYWTLKYEDYQVEKIDGVHVQIADGEYGALFPEPDPGDNSYVISGNPLVTAVNEDLLPYLDRIRQEIQYSIYTPCRVTVPASTDIRPGHIVRITDGNGLILDTYVMNKTQKGQKDTLESTGSARRDAPSVVSQKTTQDYVDAAMKRQTQLDIFNKLTNYGAVQGLFLEENGQIFVNAAYISTGILQSKNGQTFYLDLDEGILKMDASELTISGASLSEAALNDLSQDELVYVLTNNGLAEGIYLVKGQLYINAGFIKSGTLNASLIKAGILQSNDNGETFKLDLDKGTFQMSGSGKFISPDKNSYITVEGDTFVLYSKDRYGSFVDIARIGYTEDSDGVDYPYILMGNKKDDSGLGNLSLIKAFGNGIYVGNSAPKDSSGNFVGLEGAAGFFVDTEKNMTFTVTGETLRNSFVAVFG